MLLPSSQHDLEIYANYNMLSNSKTSILDSSVIDGESPNEATISLAHQRPRSSQTTAAILPSEPKERKEAQKEELDEALSSRMQPLPVKTKLHANDCRNLNGTQEVIADDPKRERQYSASDTQATVEPKSQTHCDGKTLKWYHEDSNEAFFLGLDVVLIYPTGTDKTLAFLPSLFADETGKSKLILVSPPNEFEYDMVRY